MNAVQLVQPAAIETKPLRYVEIPRPAVPPGHIRISVNVCGICHTDLHIVEGDLALPRLPLVPGHQIVGRVDECGDSATLFKRGDRVGVPWLYATCGRCAFCRSGRENLCDNAAFTGYQADGGYTEYMIVHESFAYSLPHGFPDVQAAPLLCAGVIGYRALRLSEVQGGQRIGLYGFGASAHIAIQILRHWECDVYVYTRSTQHRALAEELGAAWTGRAEDRAPHEIDRAVIFAPAGQLVPLALKALSKGGTIALAGIHMSPIPEMEYALIYGERALRSVANSTREDVRELLKLAAEIPIRTEVESFPLAEANEALLRLKQSEINGSGVLVIREGG